MMRILDRLDDTPAQIMSGLGETLIQTRLAVALVGDQTHYTGFARSIAYRWFTDPGSRRIYLEGDHPWHGRVFTAQLRAAVTRDGPHSRATVLAHDLLQRSPEFAAVWHDHEIGIRLTDEEKRLIHPELGPLELHCQVLLDPDQSQSLLVYTATPGTESHEKLQLLSIIGAQGAQGFGQLVVDAKSARKTLPGSS
jgi:hypothetical protein